MLLHVVGVLLLGQAVVDAELPRTLDCGLAEKQDARPAARLGKPAMLKGARRLFVLSEHDQGAWQTIVNVVARDAPQLRLVERLSEAEVVLAFETLTRLYREDGVYELVGGEGRGCVYRQDPLGTFAVVLTSPAQGIESRAGARFAEAFVAAYRSANAAR